MKKSFDVAVIGSGPGGYIAAIRAAQLGLSVACIDEWTDDKGKPVYGGTCLNVGCIPSKALLESSENYERAAHKFAEHGVKVDGVEIDVPKMIARKEKIVQGSTAGVAFLFRKNKITPLLGTGSFVAGDGNGFKIQVTHGEQNETIDAKHVIVATGSVPRELSLAPFDNALILDNTGALALTEVPKRLGVIGAGVIGLEMGSVWRRLGAEVTILEALPEFLMAADAQVAKEAYRAFTKDQGLAIHTGVKITGVKTGKKKVTVEYQDKDGNAQHADFDRLIVAIGRVPNTKGLNPEAVGLKLDAKGFIEVDAQCRTNVPNVYAIGDVVRGPMLAHKASEEGVMAAELIAGQAGHFNLETVPWVIYTSPEIAWVGKTEQQLKDAGIDFRAGRFPFSANGRARAIGETAGFIKVLADAKTDRILGVHMVGPYVSELIAEAVVAMEFAASSEDIARIVHAHPSLSEVMHEAALGVDQRTLNI
ncbi:MAG TPA: dihydrolipoyl dehydrogenase [Burkholderiales bacterium]|nr:dihydrolipoyl dehydrogenase [Burkholderiales bacterium]